MSLHPKLDKFNHPKRVRTRMNDVTGELTHTTLDDVQLTFERIVGHMELQLQPLSIEDARRCKDKVAGALAEMYPHCDSDLDRAEWAALVAVLSRRLADIAEKLKRVLEGRE